MRPPSLARIVLLRALPLMIAGVLLSFVPPGNIVLLIDGVVIFGHERRCLHDYIAGTKVVKAPKKR